MDDIRKAARVNNRRTKNRQVSRTFKWTATTYHLPASETLQKFLITLASAFVITIN